MKLNKLHKMNVIYLFLLLLNITLISCNITNPNDVLKGYTKIEWQDNQFLNLLPDKFYFEEYFSTIPQSRGPHLQFHDSSVGNLRRSRQGWNTLTIWYPGNSMDIEKHYIY